MIRQPVIILGMHRSGTTLLVKILKSLGLFIGAKRGRNEEAIYFQSLNEWLLRRCGGSWDHPLLFKQIYTDKDLYRDAIELFRKAVSSSQFREFTGFLGGASMIRRPWGWKDPRTVFTVKLWLEVFPDAKILYIKRNGVDVAQSLTVRAKNKSNSSVKDIFSVMPLWWRMRNAFREHEQFIKMSLRCRSLVESYRLWEEYSQEAEQFYDIYEGQKYSLRYEDFLEEPRNIIGRILALCNLQPSERDVDTALKGINKDRAYSFINDEHLVDFYKGIRNSELMRKMGYDSIEC